jgi:nucleoside-diphosphate-sugar epimerase
MSDPSLPDIIADLEQLDELLSRPTAAVVHALSRVEGDIVVLGVAGKMGPTLARMARRASNATSARRRIIGVSRFSKIESRRELQSHGIETIQGDLLDPHFVDSLPEVPNVIYMAGMKFGATGKEPLTWAMNAYLPALVCRKFRRSRLLVFSTGNVYGAVPIHSGGSRETDPPDPRGEYAMSCLGRERMIEHFSQTLEIPAVLIRLNYAVEMRYGVLVDLAQKVYGGQTIDLTMGYLNAIWQGEANARALCALPDACSPPLYLNVAGHECLSVREICERFAQLMEKPVQFSGVEAADALLSNADAAARRYGPTRINADQMIRWIAHWLTHGGPTLGKPTHFEVRDGKF